MQRFYKRSRKENLCGRAAPPAQQHNANVFPGMALRGPLSTPHVDPRTDKGRRAARFFVADQPSGFAIGGGLAPDLAIRRAARACGAAPTEAAAVQDSSAS
jgi:hypothetical protein